MTAAEEQATAEQAQLKTGAAEAMAAVAALEERVEANRRLDERLECNISTFCTSHTSRVEATSPRRHLSFTLAGVPEAAARESVAVLRAVVHPEGAPRPATADRRRSFIMFL